MFAALDEYGLSDRKQEVRSWYDGFTFGDQADIYNPWSIVNYLDKRQFAPYWANSSSNGLVGGLIREGNKQVKRTFEDLMRGNPLELEMMDEQIVYDQLPKRRDAIWGLLLASGYLKVLKQEFDGNTGRRRYTLALTNREVRLMFETMIQDWFMESDGSYNDFIKALLIDDLEAMNEYMSQVAMTTFSYFDTGDKPSGEEPERFYHGFVLGLMVELSGRYVLTSNRESGFGRYDVMLEPVNAEKDAGIIVEFKVYQPKKEKCLEDTVRAALRQIEEKRYESALVMRGVDKGNIRKYGFAFRGKNVLIGKA